MSDGGNQQGILQSGKEKAEDAKVWAEEKMQGAIDEVHEYREKSGEGTRYGDTSTERGKGKPEHML
ncbi:hypothetical protein AAVH_08842 [Aphelenchoides avenae]|nr:hypothetical protein AAVH_08842 [Aphelenchus avenae]